MTENGLLAQMLLGAQGAPNSAPDMTNLAGILLQRDNNRRNRADYHAGRQSGPEYGDIWDAMHPMDKAALATAPIPGVGDVVGLAADARALYSEPSLINAGMMALGALPLVPAVGVLKRGADAADATTDAQEIARLLREGKAADVTDDLMARADPAELHDLYVSGATGADMPMDEASRMARAQEMGFDNDGFHSTGADFPAFAGPNERTSHGTHIGTAEAANARTSGRWDDWQRERMESRGQYVSDSVLPLVYRQTNPIDMEDMIHWAPEDLTGRLEYLSDVGEIGPYNVQPRTGQFGGEYFDNRDIVGALQESGHTGFRYENVVEDAGSISHAIFDPRNIRSRFARFDPRLKHLSNLNAGVAGAVSLPLLARLMMEREQEE